MGRLAEVRHLQTLQDRCRISTMKTLAQVLREANDGKIVAVAIAIVRPDGAANTAISEADNSITLLGAVTLLQKRILADLED